ncbi:MAG: hypothetical protein AAF607_03255 [Pseudomonadota bacterium]
MGSEIPIALRRSGGGIVLHGPEFLNISVVQKLHKVSIAAAYEPLSSILRPALQGLGIEVDFGPVPGAYCDGKYNFRVRGRKLGGTAAIIRTFQGAPYTLAHVTLHINFGPNQLAAIARVERALGINKRYDLGMHTAVKNEMTSCR